MNLFQHLLVVYVVSTLNLNFYICYGIITIFPIVNDNYGRYVLEVSLVRLPRKNKMVIKHY